MGGADIKIDIAAAHSRNSALCLIIGRARPATLGYLGWLAGWRQQQAMQAGKPARGTAFLL